MTVGGGRTLPLEARRERILAEEARLVEAGAQRLYLLDTEGIDHFAVVMADPEGNEFCIN